MSKAKPFESPTSTESELEWLQRQPTLYRGHYEDLKISTGNIKIWLSRMVVADGMSHDNMVTTDCFIQGQWRRGLDPRPANETPGTATRALQDRTDGALVDFGDGA